LGGSWIHGVGGGGNPIFSLAKKANLELVKSRWERAHVFDAHGLRLPEPIVIWWLKVMSDITEFFEEELEDQNVSISEALDDYLDLNGLGKRDISTRTPILSATSGKESSDISIIGNSSQGEQECEEYTVSKDMQRTLARMALVIAGEWEWAERMEVLSARNAFQDGEQIGPDVMLPDGYWTVFDKTLMNDLREDVVYNAVVTKVTQPSLKTSTSVASSKVTVNTADGKEFLADRIVCTLPLGILKLDQVKFSPVLSDHKAVSMARVGYGTMNKVYLQWEEAFWESKSDAPSPHVILWLNDKSDGRLSIAVNYNVVVPHSNILCLMVTGESGPTIEDLPDSEIINEVLSVLRKAYGTSIPSPCNSLITRWSKDKWSGGSYSSLVLGSSHDDLKQLGKSEGKIHFAGEHTALEYLGSVHGAYFSGIRAATEILQALGKPAPEPYEAVEPTGELSED
jgi:hypothetical protein